jgi:hypothetical protein
MMGLPRRRRTLADGAIVVVAILAARRGVGRRRPIRGLLPRVDRRDSGSCGRPAARPRPPGARRRARLRPRVGKPARPGDTLRNVPLEQPAIAALVVVAAAARVGREGLHAPRQVWLIGAAVLVYLAVMTMSSALVAPQPIASLRITLWWAISAAGGPAAFVLLRGRAVAGSDAFYRRRGDLRHRRTGCRTGDPGHAYVPAAGLRPGLGDQPLRELHCGGPHPRGGDLRRTARDHGRHGGAPLKSPSLSA